MKVVSGASGKKHGTILGAHNRTHFCRTSLIVFTLYDSETCTKMNLNLVSLDTNIIGAVGGASSNHASPFLVSRASKVSPTVRPQLAMQVGNHMAPVCLPGYGNSASPNRRHLHRYQASHPQLPSMSTSSTFHSLPPEIHGQVLQNGLEPYSLVHLSESDVAAYYSTRQTFLSHVCLVSKHWHDVASSTPELWSLLQVKHQIRMHSEVRRHQLNLERVRGAEIDVILQMDTTILTVQEAFWEIWEVLKAKGGQWRSLQISKAHLVGDRDLPRLFPPTLPNLVEVRSGIMVVTPEDSLPTISAPELRHFEASIYTAVFPFTSAETLRSLRVIGPLTFMVDTLKCATSLETLEVRGGLHLFLPESPESLSYPKLRYISWIKDISSLQEFLAIIVAPNLHTISLLDAPSYPVWPTSDPISISIPSLTTIEYEMTGPDLDGLVPLRKVVEVLAEKRSLTVRVTMVIPRDIKRPRFDEIDEGVRWLEETVGQVVWDNPAADCFEFSSWQEARRYFKYVV